MKTWKAKVCPPKGLYDDSKFYEFFAGINIVKLINASAAAPDVEDNNSNEDATDEDKIRRGAGLTRKVIIIYETREVLKC